MFQQNMLGALFQRLHMVMEGHAHPSRDGRHVGVHNAVNAIHAMAGIDVSVITGAINQLAGMDVIEITADNRIRYGKYYWRAVMEAFPQHAMSGQRIFPGGVPPYQLGQSPAPAPSFFGVPNNGICGGGMPIHGFGMQMPSFGHPQGFQFDPQSSFNPDTCKIVELVKRFSVGRVFKPSDLLGCFGGLSFLEREAFMWLLKEGFIALTETTVPVSITTLVINPTTGFVRTSRSVPMAEMGQESDLSESLVLSEDELAVFSVISERIVNSQYHKAHWPTTVAAIRRVIDLPCHEISDILYRLIRMDVFATEFPRGKTTYVVAGKKFKHALELEKHKSVDERKALGLVADNGAILLATSDMLSDGLGFPETVVLGHVQNATGFEQEEINDAFSALSKTKVLVLEVTFGKPTFVKAGENYVRALKLLGKTESQPFVVFKDGDAAIFASLAKRLDQADGKGVNWSTLVTSVAHETGFASGQVGQALIDLVNAGVLGRIEGTRVLSGEQPTIIPGSLYQQAKAKVNKEGEAFRPPLNLTAGMADLIVELEAQLAVSEEAYVDVSGFCKEYCDARNLPMDIVNTALGDLVQWGVISQQQLVGGGMLCGRGWRFGEAMVEASFVEATAKPIRKDLLVFNDLAASLVVALDEAFKKELATEQVRWVTMVPLRREYLNTGIKADALDGAFDSLVDRNVIMRLNDDYPFTFCRGVQFSNALRCAKEHRESQGKKPVDVVTDVCMDNAGNLAVETAAISGYTLADLLRDNIMFHGDFSMLPESVTNPTEDKASLIYEALVWILKRDNLKELEARRAAASDVNMHH